MKQAMALKRVAGKSELNYEFLISVDMGNDKCSLKVFLDGKNCAYYQNLSKEEVFDKLMEKAKL